MSPKESFKPTVAMKCLRGDQDLMVCCCYLNFTAASKCKCSKECACSYCALLDPPRPIYLLCVGTVESNKSITLWQKNKHFHPLKKFATFLSLLNVAYRRKTFVGEQLGNNYKLACNSPQPIWQQR